ncbi:hypothetical protein JAAARDRAFT_146039 [Jaapia argillacea MUCL 33604]|uniref:F-box domain-containing protein n=1 Tax=Jaapia argillacea MUCL 33604 TaxID=933084 RepID=A0A067QQB4_9AGAM|nr:hypothetical protein JAAARDRAFT_146039 [Jaapia argillacea MUCL 33604]
MFRAIYALRDTRAEHETRIRNLKGLISLARRMPPELLAKIFQHCVEGGWYRAPTVVSQVCSRWRLGTSFPRVWSNVYVNCEDKNPLGRTRHWLSMASQAPLHITVDARINTSDLPDIMDLLLTRVSQWRSFTIITDRYRDANYLLSRCTLPAPDLSEVGVVTEVDFRELVEGGNTDLVGFQDAFQQAPRLTTLKLACNTIQSRSIIPPNILNLSITMGSSRQSNLPLSGASLIQLLESLPLLRQFTMSVPFLCDLQYMPEADFRRTAHIPHLESLEICVPPNVNGILAHLRAPQLRKLHLRSSEDPLGRPHDLTGASLREFIEQSSPPLEILELHDIDAPDDDYAHCLAVLDQLQELRLHETEISDDVVQMLNGPTGYCPRLSRIDLRWCAQLTGRTLVDLVKSRNCGEVTQNGAVAPISEVTVMNCSFVEEQDVLDLSNMTMCRLVLRDSTDHCYQKGCCTNVRYRQRLRLRHLADLIEGRHGRTGLIL